MPGAEAANRGPRRAAKPCPPEKRLAIKKAFEHLGMLA
jgi:hypothetical protein